uniref:Semaphorin-6C n=1 Tax=Bos indicus x Bos taurus TaxID=30522 RepID=A0A4W2H3H0_BOBOX
MRYNSVSSLLLSLLPSGQRSPTPLKPPQESPPQAAFPQDPLPLLTSDLHGISPLSWFRGLEDDAVVAELGLDFQRFLTLNRTLLVAARDHVFSFDLQAQEEGEGLVPNKYLTWRSQDVENCAVRGKLTDECYNYIRVLVPWDSQTLLACGTNSFSPVCRSYGITSLQQEGEELSGQARCPFDATQSNVAVFAEGSLYSATAADFQASDAVVYRSLGPQPPLRSAKYDSKWLREPHFVHALEHGDHVYFFFREVSVEDARLGRVQFSRVARVCKRDMGGSPRALDRHWTSFLKLRLNCSVPGDSTFYFDVLQALTGPVNLYGRSALFGVFTTQTNSIPGSAVCAFYLDDIERGFEGKFKEQRSLDGAWTPVSEDRVPSPRPGSCAGVGVAALFPSSRDLPDDVLTFIKAHPLLDPAVPPATHQPLLTLTSRALLTQVAVDGMAGPYSNITVLFLGSNDGTVLKVLPPGGQSGGSEPILLEEIDAYSPSRCSGKRAAQTARRVIGLELDTEGHRLFVAFSGCIIYLPLSRCARHGACRRSCLASQDPYCGWDSSRGCVDIRAPGGIDVDPTGNQESMEHDDCQDGATGSQSGTGDSTYVLLSPGPSPETPSPPSDAHPRPQSSTLGAHTQGVRRDLPPASSSRSVPIPLLLACVAAAFALGASVSGLLVSCACRRAHRRRSKDIESAGIPRPLSLRSLARLHGAGPEPPPPSKDGEGAQTPQLYTTFLPPPRAYPRRSWPACPPRSPRQSCRSSTSAMLEVPGSGTRTGITPRRAGRGSHHLGGTTALPARPAGAQEGGRAPGRRPFHLAAAAARARPHPLCRPQPAAPGLCPASEAGRAPGGQVPGPGRPACALRPSSPARGGRQPEVALLLAPCTPCAAHPSPLGRPLQGVASRPQVGPSRPMPSEAVSVDASPRTDDLPPCSTPPAFLDSESPEVPARLGFIY